MKKLLIPVLLLAACSNKPEVPKHVLPPEKMEAITWDMIRADGLLTHALNSDTLTPPLEKRVQLYQQVLRIHEVTREQYRQSFAFYQNRPDLLREVFSSMVEKANVVPQFKKDSVKVNPS